MSWSPFGEGKENIFKNPILINIAKNYKKTVVQIILRFLTQNNIIVIPKSSHKNRIKRILIYLILNYHMKICRLLNRWIKIKVFLDGINILI